MSEITTRDFLKALTAGVALATIGCWDEPRIIRVARDAPVPLRKDGPLANYSGLTADRKHFNLRLGDQGPKMFPRTGEITLAGVKYRVMRADSLDLYLGEVR